MVLVILRGKQRAWTLSLKEDRACDRIGLNAQPATGDPSCLGVVGRVEDVVVLLAQDGFLANLGADELVGSPHVNRVDDVGLELDGQVLAVMAIALHGR